MTIPEALARIDFLVQQTEAHRDELLALKAALAKAWEDERVLLAGPQRGTGARVTSKELLAEALGVDKVELLTGGDNVSLSGGALHIFTPGGVGKEYRDAKFGAWIPIDETPSLDVSYQIGFPEEEGPFGFGWQAKAGIGVQRNEPGNPRPGGGVLYPHDWYVRPIWNDYRGRRAAKGLPPLWGVYCYTPTELGHNGWGERIKSGGGYRKVILFPDAPGPLAGEWYRIAYSLRAEVGETILDFQVDGETVWAGSMGPLPPANKLVVSFQYGGSSDGEGPARNSRVTLGDLRVSSV